MFLKQFKQLRYAVANFIASKYESEEINIQNEGLEKHDIN